MPVRMRLSLLALVVIAGLAPFHHPADQDLSRFCLTRAIVHGSLRVDGCIDGSVDRSRYDGHLYSNKAPGMSLAAVPAYAVAVAAGGIPAAGIPRGRWLWLLRVTTAGAAFVALALLAAALGDRFQRGLGAPTAVAVTLATPALAFAATAYDHVPATALLLGAFLALWSRRPALAGAAAGCAVLVEYQSALPWLVLLGYAAWGGRRAAGRYVAASLPPLVLLAAYDWAAFGAPWHNPLTYSDNRYEQAQRSGLLGIHAPSLHGLHLVLIDQKGLLVTTPVLAVAAAGLVLSFRRHLRESVTAGVIALAYLLAEIGYFDPYAGFSPVPRYAIPGVAFLLLGLPEAFRRWPLATWMLTLASTVASVAIALTWALGSDFYQGTIWTQLAHVLTERGHSRLPGLVAPTVLPVPHAALLDALVVSAAAALALWLAASESRPEAPTWRARRGGGSSRTRRP